LSALLSDSTATPNEDLLEIHIELIDPNPSQPRTNFDEARLEELAQSIRSNGIVQPLLVRRHGMRYQLVAGERRWRAAQRAGLERVPAVVREIPDDKLLELALIENIQRQELNAIEEAHAYKSLIEAHGLTQESVAQHVGRDRSFITNYLRLLRLPIDIQTLLEEEKITTGHARALLGVAEVDIQRRVAKHIVDQALSVRETERLCGATGKRKAARRTSLPDAHRKSLEEELSRRGGTRVRLRGTLKKGRVEIHYFSPEELDRLCNVLFGTR